MNIQITSRHSKVSQETHDYLKSELASLEKYYDRITSIHVIINNEQVKKVVEIVINVQGNTVAAKGKGENLGKAMDISLEKIKRQLKKFNEKLKNHKNKKEPIPTFDENVYSEETL